MPAKSYRAAVANRPPLACRWPPAVGESAGETIGHKHPGWAPTKARGISKTARDAPRLLVTARHPCSTYGCGLRPLLVGAAGRKQPVDLLQDLVELHLTRQVACRTQARARFSNLTQACPSPHHQLVLA